MADGPDFWIRQGDTRPWIEATLTDANGPVPLHGATVEFHLSDDTGGERITDDALILNEDEGLVTYEWKPGDTEFAGDYRAEWQVTFAEDDIGTFPNTGYTHVRITKQLA